MCSSYEGVLCYILLAGGRSPSKILIARDSGKLHQVDFMPMYSDRAVLERTETVPFRLTRNLHTFFTAFGVEGMFTTAMVAAAQALLQKDGNISHVLSCFFKEDLLSWTSRRTGKSGRH